MAGCMGTQTWGLDGPRAAKDGQKAAAGKLEKNHSVLLGSDLTLTE